MISLDHVFGNELTLCVSVAQGAFPHIGHLYRSLRAGIHEDVATQGVEFGRSDYFSKFFHVCRLDVDNVKTLILNVQIPEVYPQIIAADEGLPIAIDRDAVDMVGVCVCIRLSRHSSNDGIMVSQPGELEVGGTAEMLAGRAYWRTAAVRAPRC